MSKTTALKFVDRTEVYRPPKNKENLVSPAQLHLCEFDREWLTAMVPVSSYELFSMKLVYALATVHHHVVSVAFFRHKEAHCGSRRV